MVKKKIGSKDKALMKARCSKCGKVNTKGHRKCCGIKLIPVGDSKKNKKRNNGGQRRVNHGGVSRRLG